MTPMHFTFFLVMTLAITPAYSDDLQALYARSEKSVLSLKTYDRFGQEKGQGTGFLIPGGLIITNYHVIDGVHSLHAVVDADRKFAVLNLLASDERNDLAVLRAANTSLPALELATAVPAVGERIVVVGNPLGLSKTLSEGLISAYRLDGIDGPDGKHHDGLPILQVTAPISPGSSGSPVMNMRGAVVGVAVSGYAGGQNLNFAVPAEAVAKLLATMRPEHAEKSYTAPPEGRSILRNIFISSAVISALSLALYLLGRKKQPTFSDSSSGRVSRVKPFRTKA